MDLLQFQLNYVKNRTAYSLNSSNHKHEYHKDRIS